MNSLEFIDKEIESLKAMLELDDVLCELSDNDYKFCNDRLKTLHQIKSELEVWYVVKPCIRFEEHSRAWIYLNKIYKDEPSPARRRSQCTPPSSPRRRCSPVCRRA